MSKKLTRKPESYPKSFNLGLQDFHIKQKFPEFKLKKDQGRSYWVGFLRPTPNSERYTIKIQFHPYRPKVFVMEPKVLPAAPHRYSDGSLCLFHPNDNSFNGQKLISDTIIPWTTEWLYFYEGWLKEGVWWGKEAPHSPFSLISD